MTAAAFRPIMRRLLRCAGTASASTAPACGRCTKQLASAGGDVEPIEIGPAEAAFVRQVRGDRMAFDRGSVRSEDMHQRPRTAALPSADRDDVAVGVEAHALD